MRSIVISAGHGKHVPGAIGYLDEFEEAVRVVEQVTTVLEKINAEVVPFVDVVSKTQTANLHRIVDFHNSHDRDLDVSVHFNDYQTTSRPMGTECLYVTQDVLAQQVAVGIADVSGLQNRGPKKRTDLYFLNKTTKPSILIEVCFVDSRADADLYNSHFEEICRAIARTIVGEDTPSGFHAVGKCATFGGPSDTGMSPSEGLAFITRMEQAPYLFLPFQPPDTSGLGRRLNPFVHYVACRWDYDETPREDLLTQAAVVKAPSTGISLKAFPADWGPNASTGRVADLSPSLMDDLGIKTDDEVEVSFPA